MKGNKKSCQCEKVKKRSEQEKRYYRKRLNVIEGQIRGIQQMITEDRYCGDILIQVSAVNKSLKGLANQILKEHLSTCVVENIQENRLEIIEEVLDLMKKLDY